MKAVILIGGKGTRLRPLTLETAKPLLPVVNRPFLRYQLDVLRGHVDDVILCAADPRPFRRALGARIDGMRLTYLSEDRPLGTGGAVKNAERALAGEKEFLVLNGDVLNNIDVTALVRAHRKGGRPATIALTRVADPTMYGLVRVGKSGAVSEFVEKPSMEEADVNTVNAGAYVFDSSVLTALKSVPSSLERELFPSLLSDGGLQSFESRGYWIDIGTLERYLQSHLDLLAGRALLSLPKTTPSLDGGRVAVGKGSVIDETVRFSGNVSVGASCRIGAGSVLRDCVLLDGVRVGENARLEGCIIGPRSRIGPRSELVRCLALAGGSRIEPFSRL